MDLPRLLFDGDWSEDRVDINHVASSRTVDPDFEEEIKRNWDIVLRGAIAGSKKVWDSQLYRFEEAVTDGHKLTMSFSTVPFSVAKGMNGILPEVIAAGEQYFVKSLFVATMIKTTDGFYVFGRNSGNNVTSLDIMCIGGVLSRDEQEIKDSSDLFGCQYREMLEEMNLDKSLINSCMLRAGILSTKLKVALMFEVLLDIDRVEVERLFSDQNDKELSELIFVEKNDLNEFLMTQESYLAALAGLHWN